MTDPDRRILDAFPPPPGETFALELTRATGLGHGSVTGRLFSLHQDGLVADRWEDEVEAAYSGRPARRMWRLTPDGQRVRFEQRGYERAGWPALEARG